MDIFAILLIVSAVVNLILLNLYENSNQERKRIGRRLENVLVENESLFRSQFKDSSINLLDIDFL